MVIVKAVISLILVCGLFSLILSSYLRDIRDCIEVKPETFKILGMGIKLTLLIVLVCIIYVELFVKLYK